jgi:hypothetical protein
LIITREIYGCFGEVRVRLLAHLGKEAGPVSKPAFVSGAIKVLRVGWCWKGFPLHGEIHDLLDDGMGRAFIP